MVDESFSANAVDLLFESLKFDSLASSPRCVALLPSLMLAVDAHFAILPATIDSGQLVLCSLLFSFLLFSQGNTRKTHTGELLLCALAHLEDEYINPFNYGNRPSDQPTERRMDTERLSRNSKARWSRCSVFASKLATTRFCPH